jgi:YegS/Rv2252/BmrU family lipid kinase
VHEVANGFFDGDGRPVAAGASLGFVPFGTGGDFRKSVHIPKGVAEAARVLKEGQRREIDLGRLVYAEGGRGGPRASRVFINIASFGIGGLVDRIVNSSSKAFGGAVSFFLGTARAALVYKNQRVRMSFEGDEADFLEMPINNVAVANGQYFGGGMHIAPRAELDDGKFDVVVLGDLGKLDFLKDGHRVYKGTHLDLPKVRFRQAARVDASPVDPDAEVLLDVDGEAPGALPASFTLLPKALGLVMPS